MTFSCRINSASLIVRKFYINHQDNLSEADWSLRSWGVTCDFALQTQLQYISELKCTHQTDSDSTQGRQNSYPQLTTGGCVSSVSMSSRLRPLPQTFKCSLQLGLGDAAVYPRLALTSWLQGSPCLALRLHVAPLGNKCPRIEPDLTSLVALPPSCVWKTMKFL